MVPAFTSFRDPAFKIIHRLIFESKVDTGIAQSNRYKVITADLSVNGLKTGVKT
jgi:hypothetical protein